MNCVKLTGDGGCGVGRGPLDIGFRIFAEEGICGKRMIEKSEKKSIN